MCVFVCTRVYVCIYFFSLWWRKEAFAAFTYWARKHCALVLINMGQIWRVFVTHIHHQGTSAFLSPFLFFSFFFEKKMHGLFLALSSCDITSVCVPGPLRTTPRGTGGRRPPFIPPQLLTRRRKRRKKGTCTSYKWTKLHISVSSPTQDDQIVMLSVFLNVIRPVRWSSFISKIKFSTKWKMPGLLPLLELSKDSRCPVFQARVHADADGDGHDHHHYQVWTHTWHKVTIDTWFGGGGGHTELTWVDKSRPPPTPVYQFYSVFWKEKKNMAELYGGCSLRYRLLRLMAGV